MQSVEDSVVSSLEAMDDEVLQCRIAVLGLCLADTTGERREGVGKSCACSRFVHPALDSWKKFGQDHSHELSASEFKYGEINGDHFLYHGAVSKDYRRRGGPNESSTSIAKGGIRHRLSVHVVEHTTFVDESNGRPFAGAERYAERATVAYLQSEDKCAYVCRSELGMTERARPFPNEDFYADSYDAYDSSGYPKGVHGFVYVLDPTAPDARRRQQWKLWENCWKQLDMSFKEKCVLVLTKCDELTRIEMDGSFRVVDHFMANSGKSEGDSQGSNHYVETAFQDCGNRMAVSHGSFVIPVFFTSATEGVGIDLPFFYLAHVALQLPGRPEGPAKWLKAVKVRRDLEYGTLLAADAFFRRRINSQTLRLKDIAALPKERELQTCREVHGEEVLQSLFKSFLLSQMAETVRENSTDTPYAEKTVRARTWRKKKDKSKSAVQQAAPETSEDLPQNMKSLTLRSLAPKMSWNPSMKKGHKKGGGKAKKAKKSKPAAAEITPVPVLPAEDETPAEEQGHTVETSMGSLTDDRKDEDESHEELSTSCQEPSIEDEEEDSEEYYASIGDGSLSVSAGESCLVAEDVSWQGQQGTSASPAERAWEEEDITYEVWKSEDTYCSASDDDSDHHYEIPLASAFADLHKRLHEADEEGYIDMVDDWIPGHSDMYEFIRSKSAGKNRWSTGKSVDSDHDDYVYDYIDGIDSSLRLSKFSRIQRSDAYDQADAEHETLADPDESVGPEGAQHAEEELQDSCSSVGSFHTFLPAGDDEEFHADSSTPESQLTLPLAPNPSEESLNPVPLPPRAKELSLSHVQRQLAEDDSTSKLCAGVPYRSSVTTGEPSVLSLHGTNEPGPFGTKTRQTCQLQKEAEIIIEEDLFHEVGMGTVRRDDNNGLVGSRHDSSPMEDYDYDYIGMDSGWQLPGHELGSNLPPNAGGISIAHESDPLDRNDDVFYKPQEQTAEDSMLEDMSPCERLHQQSLLRLTQMPMVSHTWTEAEPGSCRSMPADTFAPPPTPQRLHDECHFQHQTTISDVHAQGRPFADERYISNQFKMAAERAPWLPDNSSTSAEEQACSTDEFQMLSRQYAQSSGQESSNALDDVDRYARDMRPGYGSDGPHRMAPSAAQRYNAKDTAAEEERREQQQPCRSHPLQAGDNEASTVGQSSSDQDTRSGVRRERRNAVSGGRQRFSRLSMLSQRSKSRPYQHDGSGQAAGSGGVDGLERTDETHCDHGLLVKRTMSEPPKSAMFADVSKYTGQTSDGPSSSDAQCVTAPQPAKDWEEATYAVIGEVQSHTLERKPKAEQEPELAYTQVITSPSSRSTASRSARRTASYAYEHVQLLKFVPTAEDSGNRMSGLFPDAVGDMPKAVGPSQFFPSPELQALSLAASEDSAPAATSYLSRTMPRSINSSDVIGELSQLNASTKTTSTTRTQHLRNEDPDDHRSASQSQKLAVNAEIEAGYIQVLAPSQHSSSSGSRDGNRPRSSSAQFFDQVNVSFLSGQHPQQRSMPGPRSMTLPKGLSGSHSDWTPRTTDAIGQQQARHFSSQYQGSWEKSSAVARVPDQTSDESNDTEHDDSIDEEEEGGYIPVQHIKKGPKKYSI